MKNKVWPGYISILVLLLVGGLLSGCSSSARPTNWTNLVVSDGIVYAADMQQVVALDAESGDELWIFPPGDDGGGPFYTVSLQDGEAIYVTSLERAGGGLFAKPPHGAIRALALEDRRPLWPTPITRSGEFAAAGAIADGLLVIGNGDGNVYAFTLESGGEAWSYTTGGRVWATPLILSDTVYIASLDHSLYALELETGREVWQFEADGAMAARPLPLHGILYIGAFDNRVYALEQETGAKVWHFQGENWFWGTPATDGTLIYVVDVSGDVYALDSETGSEVWSAAVNEPVHVEPVLSQDGDLILVAGDSGTLYGLDASDGFMVWSQPGSGQLGSLAVVDQVVYVTRINAQERVQAFYVDNGRPLWVYPQPEAEE